MTVRLRLLVLLAASLAAFGCARYEMQKENLVRTFSAAVFRVAIRAQQCAAMKPPAAKRAISGARTAPAAKTVVTPVRSCRFWIPELPAVRRS